MHSRNYAKEPALRVAIIMKIFLSIYFFGRIASSWQELSPAW
jgi:hypothetical protein